MGVLPLSIDVWVILKILRIDEPSVRGRMRVRDIPSDLYVSLQRFCIVPEATCKCGLSESKSPASVLEGAMPRIQLVAKRFFPRQEPESTSTGAKFKIIVVCVIRYGEANR